MKKFILKSATILIFSFSAIAQDGSSANNWLKKEDNASSNFSNEPYFEVRGLTSHSVTRVALNKARNLKDFIAGYPVNWMDEYVSVEISATCNGKTMNAVSSNDVLNADQIKLLHGVDLGATIIVNVNYKTKNAANDHIANRTMYIELTVIPEIEAEYFGGYQQLSEYLRKKVVNKISQATPPRYQHGEVLFTVNEEGKAINVKIAKSSGDQATDKLLLDAINRMPNWKPAENANGAKVKQDFVFNLSNGC